MRKFACLFAWLMLFAPAAIGHDAGSGNPIHWTLDDQVAEYPGDGQQVEFKLDFPHVRQRWMRPWLKQADGREIPLDSNQYSWIGDEAIRIDPPPPVGTTVSIRATNGLRVTTDTRVLHAFFITGQSNAAGSNKDPEQRAIAVKPLYPGYALMPNTGVRPEGRFDDFADLVENGPERGIGLKETGASGLANHFIRKVDEVFGFKPRVFCAVVALGGRPIAQIGPGSETSNALLDAVRDCVAAAHKRGWRVVVPAVPFNQGEQDYFYKTARSQYVRSLIAFQRHLEGEIRAITGQVEPVVLVMTQTRTSHAEPYYEPTIALAQLDADGLPGIRLAGPKYQYGRSDSGHLDIMGQNRQGQCWARAILAECYGQGWQPLRPVRWRWASPSELDVQFHVPVGPLALDTQGDVDVTSMTSTLGFNFADGGAAPPAIRAVRLLPDTEDTVRVELDRPSTGPRPWLGYANHKDQNASPDGRVSGSRGCLRDSQQDVSLYDGHVSYNWCVTFAIDLPPAPSAR